MAQSCQWLYVVGINTETMQLRDIRTDALEDSDGYTFVNTQDIPKAYLDELADYRKAQTRMQRCREYHRVASIPVIIVHEWLKDGFDVFRASAKEIIKRLHRDNLTAFITTEKRI